jgi:hypothetical protein
LNINSLLKIFCRLDYHIKTRLVDVSIGFGPTGTIEKIECEICKKVFVKKNQYPNTNALLVLIIIIILLIVILIV